VAVEVEAPQADSSTRPRAATNARERICGTLVKRRQLELVMSGNARL